MATEQHFLPLVCAPTPYAESDGRSLHSAPRDGVDAIRISLVRLSENATAEFLSSFFLPSHRSLNHFSSMLTVRTRIRHPNEVASSSRCRGGEEGVIHDLAVCPPASRLHDAQNCPACYRTVILPSMTHHPTHRASSCFLWAWLHSSGPAWHAWPVLLSSLLRRPEASLCTSRRSRVCLSSAIIRPLLLPPLPAFWFAARFAGPLFMTKISECNAFELTQSEVQRPDIGCCFTGYDGIFIV